MNRELVLALTAFAVVVLALTSLALTGAVSSPDEPDTGAAVESAGHASLLEVTIAADEITGETATLEVDTYLGHHGDDVDNVTVVHRATDRDTSLVEDTTEREVGTLSGESETVVSGTIDVPRSGSHRIETFVYVDGVRTESTTHRISGVESLTPAYADTGLEFHRFGGDAGSFLATVPALEYSIESTTDDEAELEVTSYLTNTGDDPADSLSLEVKARQADSNIVADSETVDLSAVEPGETATPTATLEVADEYEYYLDAVLWLDGTIVATDRAGADLRPASVVANETDADSRLDSSDFESDGDGFETTEEDANGGDRNGFAADDANDAGRDSSVEDGTPGFGVVVAVVALLGAVGIARRYTDD